MQILPLPPLKSGTKQAIAPVKVQDFGSDRGCLAEQRLTTGGKPFVEAVKSYGCNERGESIKLTPWFLEYLEAIGDFRIPHILTSGCSQVGKTLGHSLLLCDCLTELGLNTLWSYDQERSLNIQVPSNFRPVIRGWLKKRGIKAKSDDAQNNTLYQINGASAQFVYVSTSKVKDSGGAAAGGIAVGVSRDILFKEERSQYPPGAGDPLNRRLDAGRIPTRPIRELGTPGAGQGIEAEIKAAKYHFYPHYRCDRCEVVRPLDPKGCLLKSVMRETATGEKRMSYFSDSGRPLEWWCSDPGDAIATTYFGCSACGDPIPDESRLNAWFQCLKTGVRLREFLDSLPPGVPKQSYSIGIVLSPLLRVEKTNVAAAIVDEGLKTYNTADWQQQRLGHPSEAQTTSITLDMLERAIAAERPAGIPDYTLAGLDQGRGEDWLWVCDFWLPSDRTLPIAQVVEKTVRGVRFGANIERKQVPGLLRDMGVSFGICDNEPDIPDAAKLCSATCLEMADQKSNTAFVVNKSIVMSGGAEYPCWFFRQEDFLKAVLEGFTGVAWDNKHPYRLPDSWDKWRALPNDERSPVRHLMGPSRDPETGKWKRGQGNIDDLYYAAMFCELAFYLSLTGETTAAIARAKAWTL